MVFYVPITKHNTNIIRRITMVSENQIVENWEKLLNIVDKFRSERKDNLKKMYDYLAERMASAPASSIEHYHNAFPGGYVDHVLRVIDLCGKKHNLYKNEGFIIDYSQEELIFSALHHDLGKIGDFNNDFYIPNTSQWHKDNQGKMFNTNDKINIISKNDRTLFILQHFGVTYSENEQIGMKWASGYYDEENKQYFDKYLKLKRPIPMIVNVLTNAVEMAIQFEKNKWYNSNTVNTVNNSTPFSAVSFSN